MKSDAIINAVQGVTKKWAKQRKAEERSKAAALNRRVAMTRSRPLSIRDAAFAIMEQAYIRASVGGRLPAHARQIMYAARPYIQQRTGRELSDQYFTQQLLPEYVDARDCAWNVVYDARGNFLEPHTEKQVPIGTLQVRGYLGEIQCHAVGEPDFDIWEKRFPTKGPELRFGGLLFIEKEGFHPLFKAVKLAERYDLAIMSTKGMSVTASRLLVERLCAEHDVPLLVLHDFDKAGFSIGGTLKRSTRRYRFGRGHAERVIDLGLRLEDIEEDLESEAVYYRESQYAVAANLRENGATEDEIQFLLQHRVELNALPSDRLVALIERKFVEHGIAKVIPNEEIAAIAYRRMRKQAAVQDRIDELLLELEDDDPPDVPDNLIARIREKLSKNPAKCWDAALRQIAEEDHDEAAP
jgi:hypothetical protein